MNRIIEATPEQDKVEEKSMDFYDVVKDRSRYEVHTEVKNSERKGMTMFLTSKCELFQVCRFFLATLQLANTCNVEIIASEVDVADRKFQSMRLDLKKLVRCFVYLFCSQS